MITIGDRQACTHGLWDTTAPTWRDDLHAWVVTQHDRHGYGWAPIADMLNRERVPPLGGGDGWRASSVKSLYEHPVKNLGGGRR